MSADDGVVQLPTDGPGRKVDVSEQVRNDGTTVVRQRIAIGGDADANTFTSSFAEVGGEPGRGALKVDGDELSYLQMIHAELLEIKFLLLSVIAGP